ncbi:MAG: hypothetical protein EBS38_06235 [Actinobacteria bacterium]|nr:hypothetical protein [Actinomycetota bacterium]
MSNFLIVTGYLAFVIFGVVLAVIGRSRPEVIAPLSELLKFIMRHRITRIALFMVWWWLGWHFLVGTTVN